MFVQTTNQLRR